MICGLCAGAHHAMSCRIARSTLEAAGVRPARPAAPTYREAYRDEIQVSAAGRSLLALHELLIEEGQRMWVERRGPLTARQRRVSGVGRGSNPRDPQTGRWLPIEQKQAG